MAWAAVINDDNAIIIRPETQASTEWTRIWAGERTASAAPRTPAPSASERLKSITTVHRLRLFLTAFDAAALHAEVKISSERIIRLSSPRRAKCRYPSQGEISPFEIKTA